jgi:hypothetical protein
VFITGLLASSNSSADCKGRAEVAVTVGNDFKRLDSGSTALSCA